MLLARPLAVWPLLQHILQEGPISPHGARHAIVDAHPCCVRLLASASIASKPWFDDMRRALGGRLRPFALAAVATSECDAEVGVLALLGVTIASLFLARFTAQAVVQRERSAC